MCVKEAANQPQNKKKLKLPQICRSNWSDFTPGGSQKQKGVVVVAAEKMK